MTITDSAPSALALFDHLLLQGAHGRPAPLTVHDPVGAAYRMDAAGWCRPYLPGDRSLLQRCEGAILDVGCGPGRLAAALTGPGRRVLGIDVSATAVRLTRARGASAVRRDVFRAVPAQGYWQTLLLADGNVGIGGDPVRLLRRCRELLAPGGCALVELAAPGVSSWAGQARISIDSGRLSAPFPWAVVATDAVAPMAAQSGLQVTDIWQEAERWFATLARG